jgi:hypothetical protein
MENTPDVPWGTIAAVVAGLVTLRLAVRGVSALVSMASSEARYRLQSGALPKRWG